MILNINNSMEVECNRYFMDDIYSDSPEKCLASLMQLKNTVIGSNRLKGTAINVGVIPRLMQLLNDGSQSIEIQNESVVILNSLARGTEEHIHELIKREVVPLLINCIMSTANNKFSENCIKCICSIFKSNKAPVDVIFLRQATVAHLLSLINYSVDNQIGITTIFSVSIKNEKHQNMLWDEGAVYALAALLDSSHYSVVMPTLACLANLCHENKPVASSVVTANYKDTSVPDLLVSLMARDKPTEMQLASAKCVTFLFRAEAIAAWDSKILYKTLPVLVYLCRDKYPWKDRVEAAETLAYLIELNVNLQNLASMSNHLISVLTTFINYRGFNEPPEANEDIRKELLQAAFRVFACLGSNEEEIRKQIIESENLIHHLVISLDDSSTKVKLAAIRCLHSLSRSVQQLRTTFHFICATQDHSVWKPSMRLLENSSIEIITVTSSTLCNLLLEFSPSKEPLVESGIVELLCKFTKRSEAALRLNGIWALMNMAFQAEQKVKSLILNTLGIDQIFTLLGDTEVQVLMKTLGLLRNLLCNKPHIDSIMELHGTEVMRAITMILDGNHSSEVHEQALCILSNIGDGATGKDYIMNNDIILKKLHDFMKCNNVKLQVAATFCISNLAWKEEKGSSERQTKLKDLGIVHQLQQLVATTDTYLFDKVKTAITQFSDD